MSGEVRASDAERERVALVLRDHCADGRLTLDELDERLGRAYGASTRRELDAVLADLPAGGTTPQPSVGRRFFWPGMSPFHERRHLRAPCPRAYDEALREMVPRMAAAGLQLVDDIAPRRLVFADVSSGSAVTVMFHPASDGGTVVSAAGLARRAVRKAFARLSDE